MEINKTGTKRNRDGLVGICSDQVIRLQHRDGCIEFSDNQMNRSRSLLQKTK